MTLDEEKQKNQSNKERSELKQKKLNLEEAKLNNSIENRNIYLHKMRCLIIDSFSSKSENTNRIDEFSNICKRLNLTESEKKLLSKDIDQFNKTDFNFEDIEIANRINHEKNEAIDNAINKVLSKFLVKKCLHNCSNDILDFIAKFQTINPVIIPDMNKIISNSFIDIAYSSTTQIDNKLINAQIPLIIYLYLTGSEKFPVLLQYINIKKNLDKLKIKFDENTIPNDKENSSLKNPSFLSSSGAHLCRASQAKYNLIEFILAEEGIDSTNTLIEFTEKMKRLILTESIDKKRQIIQIGAIDDLHSLLEVELDIIDVLNKMPSTEFTDITAIEVKNGLNTEQKFISSLSIG